jgi:hypothetical protein
MMYELKQVIDTVDICTVHVYGNIESARRGMARYAGELEREGYEVQKAREDAVILRDGKFGQILSLSIVSNAGGLH